MKVGLVGIGKMGYNLALNFLSKGYKPVIYDIDKDRMEELAKEGAVPAESIVDLVAKLNRPRIIFLMVPAGRPTDDVIDQLVQHLEPDDIIADCGNSYYKDSMSRAERLGRIGIKFLDCGISGGIEGARNGVCAMIGGDKDVFKVCEKIFEDISVPHGYLYTGRSGSGHFCKMIHNGIEYGMMQAMAEGFELLYKSQFHFELDRVADVWNHGSVIRGWLMELLGSALRENKNLENIKGIIHSTGEGRWTVETALEMGVPVPVISLSLMIRYRSLESDTFSGKVVAALRNKFGGHRVEK